MLKLSQSELFSKSGSAFFGPVQAAMPAVLKGKGLIKPSQIDGFQDLKDYAKKSSTASPLLLQAIDDYENSGKIILFDLNIGATDNSMLSDIPPFMPFMVGITSLNSNGDKVASHPAVFVNMFRMGFWSSDLSTYSDMQVYTDLQSCLETGFIANKMIVEEKADDILGNAVVMQTLTDIYTQLFYKALISVEKFPLADFQYEMSRFLIAKFFMIHILGNDNSPAVDKYALMCSGARMNSSVDTYSSYEKTTGITYDSLGEFVKKLSETFFNSRAITIGDLATQFAKLYGEGLLLTPEYVPYLLHFLFSTMHNATLGGSSRLSYRRGLDIEAVELKKLYNAVTSLCR